METTMTSTQRFATITLATVIGVAGLQIIRGRRALMVRPTHVLLLSIDGLHGFDLERFIATHQDSALARLSEHGRIYTNATATMPSDSFPGLLAMVTGGTPRSTGCITTTATIDHSPRLAGTASLARAYSGSRTSMCCRSRFTTTIIRCCCRAIPRTGATSRVWPHQFPRVNNVFELVKAAGGRTAWSDKHPAYEFLNGPSGTGIDDLFTPRDHAQPARHHHH